MAGPVFYISLTHKGLLYVFEPGNKFNAITISITNRRGRIFIYALIKALSRIDRYNYGFILCCYLGPRFKGFGQLGHYNGEQGLVLNYLYCMFTASEMCLSVF